MGPLRAWKLVVAVFVGLLAIFAVVEWAEVPIFVDPGRWLGTTTLLAASIGVALLVVDAVAPVPSSVVMVALGAAFGFEVGLALAVVGSVGGFALGYAIGRRSRRRVGAALDPDDHRRAAGLVVRFGVLGVAVSRPLPLVAETVSMSAGAFGMRPLPAFSAALVGCSVPAAAFVYAGSTGVSTVDGAAIFAVVALLAVGCWIVGRRLSVPAR